MASKRLANGSGLQRNCKCVEPLHPKQFKQELLCLCSIRLHDRNSHLNPQRSFGPRYNHRIIAWKRRLRSSTPTFNPTPPCLLNQIPKCRIYTSFEHLQGWGLHHFPGKPVSMSDHSFSKEIITNIQFKTPLMQLEAISSHPIASYLGEQTNTCLTTTSFKVALESKKVPPQPSLLHTKKTQLPQLLLIRLVL